MKIKLFGKDLELVKVDANSSFLEPRLTGVAKLYDDIIYFDGSSPFPVLLHEIFHFHIDRAGLNQQMTYSKEVCCDMFASCIDLLVEENDIDIFKKLKTFAEEKTDHPKKNP